MRLSSNELSKLLQSQVALEEGVGGGGQNSCDVAFALFLEPRADPDPRWTALEQAIDVAVRIFQPAPTLTHCELLIPPIPTDEGGRTNFATYYGKTSGWQTDRRDGYNYYLLDNSNRWRAVPIFSTNAAALIRNEADMEIGVELVRASTPE